MERRLAQLTNDVKSGIFVLYSKRLNLCRSYGDEIPYENLLYIAVQYMHLAIVKNLLHIPGIINARIDNQTYLHIACQRPNYILNNLDEQKKLEIVKVLIANGIDINAVNNSNSTALHSEAYNRLFDIARYLIEAGIDYTIKTNKGITARDILVNNQEFEFLAWFDSYVEIPDIKEPDVY